MAGLVIGIDASRLRSGGAHAHLIGLLQEFDPLRHGIDKIHVWSYKELLDLLPLDARVVKHVDNNLDGSLVRQVFWQFHLLPGLLKRHHCDMLFTADASSFCLFKPVVVLSQDMLSYEPGVINSFGFTLARLRLILIRMIQNFAFRRASGTIFLTRYAADVIQMSCGKLDHFGVVPHGIDNVFKSVDVSSNWPENGDRPINCVYVSNAEMYKNQWNVVEAVSILRKRGVNINLKLVGGGRGRAQRLLDFSISKFDPEHEFVVQHEYLSRNSLLSIMSEADLFVFASSCENMPVTLLECMSMGLPIACSRRGPMPEVLGDGGIYFDPHDSGSIAEALDQIYQSPNLRLNLAHTAKQLSKQYSWQRCADETFAFISNTYKKVKE